MKPIKIQTLLIATFFFSFILCSCNSLQTNQPPKPKLVIVVVVDQMRADHLTRFSSVYKHGFARLLREGAVFTNAHHDHAYTVTAVGHATIATGAFPSRHGIVGNNWYDRKEKKSVYSCEDTSYALLGYPDKLAKNGRSPRLMLALTIGDWLKAQSSESKVFTVSRKDRAAILSAGMKANCAYWYNPDDGNIITSEYYAKTYPEWVNEFNNSRIVDEYFQAGWEKMMPEEMYSLAREDKFSAENDGQNTTFPHSFATNSPKPDITYYKALQNTPFSDDLILKFAEAIIENEKLGLDSSPDLLYIGCSAADAIGHNFGPRSQESMDHFLRLDGYLGDFLSYLDNRIGSDSYTVALSSDHGVMTLPEDLARSGIDAKRVSSREVNRKLGDEISRISKELGISEKLIINRSNNALLVNYDAAEKKGISTEELNNLLIDRLKKIDPITDIFTRKELLNPAKNDHEYLEAYRHTFHPDRTGDLFLRFKKFHLLRTSKQGTTHGSPYEYDTHVPIVFCGPGVKNSNYSQRVRTVDIAPTLADILGIKPISEIDGRSLLPVIAPE